MTSLSEQLLRLALPAVKVDGELAKRTSLLFDDKKAATLDKEAFYALGVNGFEELCSVDPSLHTDFYDVFFSESSRNIERSVLLKKDSEKLDEKIENFLFRIAPYIQMRPAQKCLEWLIYRFRIHCYNVDGILQSLLPYHGSKIFVKLVQLIDVSHSTSKWHWMSTIQKPGVALMRGTITNHCLNDSALFHFICDSVPKMIEANSKAAATSNIFGPVINFYLLVVLEYLNKVTTITDSFLASFIPFIIKGLKASLIDYKAATYMIISQICAKAVFSNQVVTTLLDSISRYHTGKLHEEFVISVMIVCQSQENVFILPKICLHKLCEIRNISEIIQNFHLSRNIEKFLQLFLEGLLQLVFDKTSIDYTSSNIPDYDPNLDVIMIDVIKSCQMSKAIVRRITRLAVEEYTKIGESFPADTLKLIKGRYPKVFSWIISNSFQESLLDNGTFPDIDQLKSMCAQTVKHEFLMDGEIIMLSLNNPEVTIRALAVEKLLDMLKAKPNLMESDSVRQSVRQRLEIDDSPVVVMKVLELVYTYTGIFFYDLDSACAILMKLAMKIRKFAEWNNVFLSVITLLSSDAFAFCSKQCRSYLDVLMYDIILREICLYQESSTYNIAIRGSFLEKASKLLFPISPGVSIADVITNIERLSTVNVHLFSIMWNSASEMSKFLPSFSDTKNTAVNLPSYFLIVYVAIKAMKSQELVDRHAIVLMLNKVLEDFRNLVTCFDEKQDLEPPTKIQIQDGVVQSFEHNLSILVIKFYSDSSDKMYILHVVDVLCSLIIETAKTLDVGQSPGKNCLECHNRGLFLDSKSIEFEIDHNLFCLLSLDMIYSTITELITVGEFETIKPRHSHSMNALKYLMRISLVNAFNSREEILKFLAPYWAGFCNKQKIKALAQVTALYFGNNMMQSGIDKNVLHSLLPSLLIAVSSDSMAVRRASLECLTTCKYYSTAIVYHELLCYLLEHKDEIESDYSAVVKVFGMFFSKSCKYKSGKMHHRIPNNILDELSNFLICEDVPAKFRVVLLKSLKSVKSQSLCLSLVPLMHSRLENIKNREKEEKPCFVSQVRRISFEDEFFCESICRIEANFLVNVDVKSVFFRLLSCDDELHMGTRMISPQSVSLGLITKSFSDSLRSDILEELISHLLDVGSSSSNSLTIQSVTGAFRSIKLNAKYAVRQFSHAIQLSKIDTETTGSKKLKFGNTQDLVQNDNLDVPSSKIWKRITFLLEILLNKRKILSPQLLFPSLFKLLELIFEILQDKREGESTDLGFEYVIQLVLSTMLSLFQKTEKVITKSRKIEQFIETECRTELLVYCLQSSDNLQTQQHALMLLSKIASVIPDKLLVNVMPIFTFMGAHMIKQDNEYSFQVLSRTIRSIIPALLNTGNVERSKRETVLKIIRMFVDALVHIPSHRKLKVFEEIITVLGDSEHLWILIVLLINQFSCKPIPEATDIQDDIVSFDGITKDTSTALQIGFDTWSSIVQLSTEEVQISSFIACLEYIITLPNESISVQDFACPETAKSSSTNDIILVRLRSTNQLRRIKLTLFSFFSYFLQRNQIKFVERFSEVGGNPDVKVVLRSGHTRNTEITALFRRFFEKLFYMIQVSDISHNDLPDTCMKSRTIKFLKVVIHEAYNVVYRMNFLLPLDVFLYIILDLLQSESFSTQRKAVELLARRINTMVDPLPSEGLFCIVDITEKIIKAASSYSERLGSSFEQHLLRYSSLITLKLIVRMCGRQDPVYFKNVLQVLGNITSNRREDVQILSAALLCVAELCANLKAHCISYLNCFVPSLLQLTCSSQCLENDVLLFSCVTALHRLLENLSNFVSPYLDIILVKVASLLSLRKYVSENNQNSSTSNSSLITQIGTRLKIISGILSKNLPSRILVPAINRILGKVFDELPGCIIPLSKMLHNHIMLLEKEQLCLNSAIFLKVFVDLFDMRSKDEITHFSDDIGDYVIDALISMMLKLPENSFRPIFFKFYEWACISENQQDRLLTYYKFLSKLSSQMKGLFNLFAGHLMNNLTEVLEKAALFNDSEIFPLDSDVNGVKRISLLTYVCSTIFNTMKYDTTGFLNRERFEIILHPLVNQLNNAIVTSKYIGENQIAMLIDDHVIPCLGQVAQSVSDDNCWKSLNYQILLKSRHQSAKVRCISLDAINTVAEKLGEDYMILLPESVPFLAELMEDEEEIVEKRCQDVIRNLEKIIGEPLQKYF